MLLDKPAPLLCIPFLERKALAIWSIRQDDWRRSHEHWGAENICAKNEAIAHSDRNIPLDQHFVAITGTDVTARIRIVRVDRSPVSHLSSNSGRPRRRLGRVA